MKKLKIVAFIFARSGSKGLKNKNIKRFVNKPLIQHTIDFAKKFKNFNKIVLSSNNNKILNLGIKNKIYTIKRPEILAKDNSSELKAWQHAIKYLSKKNFFFDLMVVLPCTAPLRIYQDIEKSIKLINKNTDLVLTVSKSSNHPAFNMVNKGKNNYFKLYSKTKKQYIRRQDLKPIYNILTTSYVTKPKYVLKTNSLLNGKVKAVEIPAIRSIDIDEKSDFQIAEYLYKKLKINKK